MDAAGRKPVNPFPDERAFEDSLVMNFHPGTFFSFFLVGFSNILCVVPGHQGRFAASHAMTCIGTIIDYQNNRRYIQTQYSINSLTHNSFPFRNRRRPWVPGVSNPGKPNDYVNMFLEETKTWLRTQLTLDNVRAEELDKREKYYSKLKNDNYYW